MWDYLLNILNTEDREKMVNEIESFLHFEINISTFLM